jgi:hypothetical protein
MRTMTAPPAQSRKNGTACDRCYELKERCSRTSTDLACARCERLDQNCTSSRPVRRAGRRPCHRQKESLGTTLSSQTSTASTQTIHIGAWLVNTPDLSLEEKDLLMLLLARPEHLNYYPVSRSFQVAEQRSLAALLPAALPILKHAYLAYAVALKLLQPGNSSEVEKSASLRYASAAMNTLRSFPVSSSQDAAICLTLGASLALFVYSVVGVGVADICHYCLSITNPFLEIGEPGQESDMRPWQGVLVLLETMECLVYRRKPTLRISPGATQNVDRHLGLCWPLLPFYYDLCDISYLQANTVDTCYLDYLQKQLDGIHNAIQVWQPSQPIGFINQFETAEVINLLTQARVYRLAGLLVSHRLRYLFGEQDSQAKIWSKEIMMELELSRRISKTRVRSVTLPFVVAAVEIQDTGERIETLQNVYEYVDQFTPVVQKATRTFLSRIWHERDVQVTTCWFDSVHKPCVVLHAIDSTRFPLE